ncbi:hypothetical protein HNR46_002220 [Haloferula luteola]|uniref:N-acetyltransferase domain-containing protein n=1 Tax=Haloferula luteola TaxID=595692 RepID=A0A840VDS3_9BACT|nr:GNAT family N-acetyltransferase [Haloferula luteola]MBB5351979.1 hypothetical protein [Haloferula luteola]
MSEGLRATAEIVIKEATPADRLTLRLVTWPGLPAWVAESESLAIAVAGQREILLGCSWCKHWSGVPTLGIAVNPQVGVIGAVREALLDAIELRSEEDRYWGRWLNVDDPERKVLIERGFQAVQSLRSYRIPITASGHARLSSAEEKVRRRLISRGLELGSWDEENWIELRQICLRERLISRHELDYLAQTGALSMRTSVVAMVAGEVVGFALLMDRRAFEGAVLHVSPKWRSTGICTLLLAECVKRKLAEDPDCQWIEFRGDPAAHPGSRSICLRFGGVERDVQVRMMMPGLGYSAISTS